MACSTAWQIQSLSNWPGEPFTSMHSSSGNTNSCNERLSLPEKCLEFLFTYLLWFGSMNFPGPPIIGLESWHTVLADSWFKERQFGADIVFTYGPWSFLSLSGYFPEWIGVRLIWEVFGKLVLSISTVYATRYVSSWTRWLLLASVIVISPFFDNWIQIILPLIAYSWLIVPRRSPLVLFAIATFAFLAHFKFIFFIQFLLATGACSICLWRNGRLSLSMVVAFFAPTVFLLYWLAAGQDAVNLIGFLVYSYEISSGYSSAMGLDPKFTVLLLGVVVLALHSLQILVIWRRGGFCFVVVVFFLANLFLAWKMGFTRADSHVFALFCYCFCLSLILPFWRTRPDVRYYSLAVYAVCGMALLHVTPGLLLNGLKTVADRASRFPLELVQFSNWKERHRLATENSVVAMKNEMLRGIVGEATIDAFSHDQSEVLLNGLNYTPRPVFQSYTAYTPRLAEANRRFFLAKDAPEYVYVRLETIDERYLGQDDSLALLEVLYRYTAVAYDTRFVLFKRSILHRQNSRESELPLVRVIAGFGQVVDVPRIAPGVLWMDFEMRPTLLGSIVSFLYHTQPVKMNVVLDDGRRVVRRVVPKVGVVGFPLFPFYEDHENFSRYLQTGRTVYPSTIEFCFSSKLQQFLWAPVVIRFTHKLSPL